MNSHPQHLLSEDRQEYERLLDEALRSAPDRPELAAVGQRLNPEQLRTMALNATAFITAAAATEYQHYVQVREELRQPASRSSLYESSDSVYSSTGSASATAPSALPRSDTRSSATDDHASAGLGRRLCAAVLGAGQPGGHRISDGVAAQRWAGMSYGRRLLAAVLGLRVRPEVPTVAGAAEARTPAPETTEAAGSGVFAVFAAPAAVLSGTVAAIFFVVGLVLKLFSAESASARTMITAGWVVGALSVAAILVAAFGLLLTALRNRPSLDTGPYGEMSGEVARAREAWREALLEHGILPFLREALADPGSAAAGRTVSSTPPSRIPNLGYNRPGFSSPEDGPAAGPRPSFSSPDFTSPDFGGPEHQPE
ncbi:hypothetical protein ACFV80_42710 [Streptomyces sp. NPDC059862]|uniref:hypothetical protein n=1 Tax=Streptomyces sp. NPDC059862 TaxID=3346975 RepID=UPI003659E607